MQVKTTMTDHFTPVRMATLKEKGKCWQRNGKIGTLYTVGGDVKWCSGYKNQYGGIPGWRSGLAQVAVLETQNRIPHRAPGAWSLLLPLPVSLPLSLCVCVTIINKLINKKKKEI